MHTLPPEVDLDQGEQEAIALAEDLAADLLLVDEWDARLEAERRHLRVVGTLRVLADAPAAALLISKSLSIVCGTRTFALIQSCWNPCWTNGVVDRNESHRRKLRYSGAQVNIAISKEETMDLTPCGWFKRMIWAVMT